MIYDSPPPQRLTDEQWKSRASFANEKDIADNLPAAAKVKFRALQNEVAEARAIARVPREKLDDLRSKRDQVALRLNTLVRDMGERHPLTVAEREVHDRLNGEVRAASDEYGRRVDAIGPLGNMIRRIEDYVTSLPLSVGMAPAVVPKLAKGVSLPAAIEQVRERIQEHRDAIQAAHDAPCTSADAKKKMRADITALAARGRPEASGAIDFGEQIKFPTMNADVFIPAAERGRGSAEVFDAQGMFAWLFRDPLILALEAEIDAVASDANALTAEERRRRIAASKAQLLAVEREEEALVTMARESGLTIARRPDCDCRAVLGLADSAPAPRGDD